MRDMGRAIIHPSLDLSKLNDEDLHSKLTEISKRLASASRSMVNGEIVSQLNNLQNILMNEQSERYERERFHSFEANRPKVIEIDPDLRLPDPKEQPVKREDVKKRQYVPIILKNWKKPPTDGTPR